MRRMLDEQEVINLIEEHGGGGTEYTAGTGINISAEKEISIDTDTVATKDELFSGDYNDLTNKPTIPAAQVNADWNASTGVAEILNKPDLSVYQTTANLVTSISSASTDTQYPSAKLLYDTVGDIESLLAAI